MVMMDYNILYGFFLSMLIGALVGMERERKRHRGVGDAGIRTFIIISLFGTLSAMISYLYFEYFIFVAFLAIVVILSIEYFFTARASNDWGVTTEFSALVMFILGFMCYFNEMRNIAVILSILLTVLLKFKKRMHRFVRGIDEKELTDTLKFCIIAFVILPLLPDKAIDPLSVFNPHQAWLLVVLISAISYLGYILVKILGPKKGIGITGLLGGIVSSTAVIATMASEVKANSRILRPCVFATVIANSVMFIRVLIVVFIINYSVFESLLVPMLAMAATGILISLILWPKRGIEGGTNLEAPLTLGPALKLGFLFVCVLFLSKISDIYLGESGVYITSIISGLVNVDAIVLAMTTIGPPTNVAAKAITIAAITNTAIKALYGWILGSKKFGVWIAAIFGVIVFMGLVSIFFL